MADKAIIRKEVLRKRDAISADARKSKDLSIKEKIFQLPEFQHSSTIFYFASFRSEVDTINQIKDALAFGKRVVVPKVNAKTRELDLYEIRGLSELKPGCMGIPEPDLPDERRVDINEVDLVIMPGAAFDAEGNRIGYGAGFYDKLLSRLRKKVPLIAIAFEEQMTDSIPSEPHDVRVHKIVTDVRVIECPEA